MLHIIESPTMLMLYSLLLFAISIWYTFPSSKYGWDIFKCSFNNLEKWNGFAILTLDYVMANGRRKFIFQLIMGVRVHYDGSAFSRLKAIVQYNTCLL